MAVMTSSNSPEKQLVPMGNHRAVCIGVYDLGTQPGGQFKPKRKVRIVWELCDELMADGRPFVAGKDYTNSLHEEATLRKHLESWRGRKFTSDEVKGFDIAKLLGVNCFLNVIHETFEDGSGKQYGKVTAVASMPKGMPKQAAINPLMEFSIQDSQGVFPEGMPDWLKKKIEASPEWQTLVLTLEGNDAPEAAPLSRDPGDDEDIPF